MAHSRVFGALALTAILISSAATQAATPRPKLAVLLVIDQFRADYLLRHESRFLPAHGKAGSVGGFEYLMSQGAYYPMAEYGVLQSMTCPGHATVLTGAYPYQAGIPLNGWFDAAKGQYEYCAEDSRFATVGAPGSAHAGTAPTNLIATTVGDELKNAGLPSRVVTISLKDRAAIMMGGHRADLALWMDGKERAWVSSRFYLPDGKLPDWVEKLDREIQPKPGQKIRWEATGPGSGRSDPDYAPAEDIAKIGKTFPHVVDASDRAALALPYGMELTEQAAERAVDAYRLGTGPAGAPDLLAISFSSHDYIGHAFGPNSRETEEMVVHEDRLIAQFLDHLRTHVPGGLGQVVVALTADHGIPPDPVWAKAHRIEAGAIVEKDLTEQVEKALTEKFGSPGDGLKWLTMNHDLNLYFNRKALADRKVEIAQASAVTKELLLRLPGVAQVFTGTEYAAHKLPPGLHGEQVMHTYFPGRSGDVVAIPKPYWMTDDADTVTHLTGYSYDRMVPLALVGPGIRTGVHPEYARVIDLAPTLSYLLGVLPPSLSEGQVLTGALVPARNAASTGTAR